MQVTISQSTPPYGCPANCNPPMATRNGWHRSKPRQRGTTTQRGLGSDHQKRVKQLVPPAVGQPCPGPWRGTRSPNCTRTLIAGLIDLDEDPPRRLAKPQRFRPCCRPCNRRAGAQLANKLMRKPRTVRRRTLLG